MIKTALLTGALAIGLVGGAYAQGTGPAAQTDTMNKPAATNPGSDATKKSTTTGAASGMNSGGSAATTTGGANGNPNSVPKTTMGATGNTGTASKAESPPK